MKPHKMCKNILLSLLFLSGPLLSTNAQFFTHYPEAKDLNKATVDQNWLLGDSTIKRLIKNNPNSDTLDLYVKLYTFIKKTYSNKDLDLVIDSLELLQKKTQIDPDLYFFNLYILADAYRRNKNFNKSAQYFLKIIEHGNKYNNLKAIAAGNYQVAMVFYKLKDYENSIGFFKEAYNTLINQSLTQINLYRRVEILSNIGLSFNKLDKYDSAKVYYDLALEELELNKKIEEELLAKDKLEEAKYLMFRGKISKGVILGNVGKNFLDQKKPQDAIPFLEESFEINYQREYERIDALKVLTYLVNAHYNLGDFNTFQNLSEMYLEEILEFNLFEHVQPVLINLINHYNKKGDYKKAREYFDTFYKISSITEKREFVNFFNLINENKNLKEKLESEAEIRRLQESNERYKSNRYLLLSLLIILFVGALFSISLSIKGKKLKMATDLLDEKNTLLNKTNSELNEQIAENNIVLGMVAHDLKQPISNIKGLISLREGDENEYDKLILKSIDNAENLIQDLLDISRLESSTVYFEKLSAHQIKEDLEDSFKNQLITKKIDLYFNLNVPFIIGAKSLIIRMLTNLVSNAIKFSNEGKSIWINIEKTEHNEFCIKVQDEGIGMSEEVIRELFKPFTKASRRGTLKEAGTGLGMAIVEKIAKIHGGRIEVQSTLHEGSTFYIFLPTTLLNIQKIA